MIPLAPEEIKGYIDLKQAGEKISKQENFWLNQELKKPHL